ncbi:MAG: HEAT repeat domain-containing protein [Planctomycetota bacterium]
MKHKPGEEWQEVQALRRKGASAREFWEFLFRSPAHLCRYQQAPSIGSVTVGMWQLFLKPPWETFFARWEANATETSAETSCWEILKTFPEQLYREALIHLHELFDTVSEEQEIQCCIPALLEAVQNSTLLVQIVAVQALRESQNHSPEIYPQLLPLLKSPDGTLRHLALRALEAFAPQYPSLITEILPLVRDPNTQVREEAIQALSLFPKASEQVLPILQKNLEQGIDYPYLQSIAVLALGNLKIATPAIISHLKLIVQGTFNQALRRDAVYALEKLDQKSNALLLFFRDLLNDSDLEVRRYAAMALRKKGTSSTPAIPALLNAFQDPEDEIRREIAPTLGKIKDKRAVPLLIKALDDTNAIVRRNAAKALGYIGKESIDAVPELLRKIADTDEYFLMNIVESLQRIGADPSQIKSAINTRQHIPETRDQLTVLLKNSNPELRIYASWALGYGNALTEKEISLLITALIDEHRYVRRNATWTLGNFGSQAKSAIPALIAQLNDENIDVLRNAARALGNIGDPREEVTSALWNIHYQVDKHFRFWIAIALCKLKNRLFRMIPTVQDALEDEDYYYVRKNAAEVLGSLGKLARKAVPQLQKALQDSSPEVRRQASLALAQITGEAPKRSEFL